MAMDKETFERLRETLRRIDPGAQYYALTLTADENGKIIWSNQSAWADHGSKVMWEVRVASLVHPHKILALWKAIDEPGIVVNDGETLGFFGSPYLTGVPLARFPCRDSLEGPDRYGALATSRDRRRGRR